jgi:flagellar hook assembly protein FlgD
VAWDGRDVNGGAVAPGRYTVRVTADNDLGGVSQTTALVVRRA